MTIPGAPHVPRTPGTPGTSAGPATLRDIAEITGLSISTVSRALAGSTRISLATRTIVQGVADSMGYQPNAAAKSLRAGRRGMLGVVVPDIANPFFPPVIKGAQACATQHGVGVILSESDEQPAEELRRIADMSRLVDGMIIVSPRSTDEELRAVCSSVPTVLVNREITGFNSVAIAEDTGMGQAVAHLAALGHSTICYLGGPARSWSAQERRSAVRDACTARGVALVELGPFEPQLQSGARAGDDIVAAGYDAVIAYDDLIALGLVARLRELDVPVGGVVGHGGVAVVGVDNSLMSEMSYPPLTSVQVPGQEIGEAAVRLLLDMIDAPQRPAQRLRFASRLIGRSST
ncbi:transcriptional regulator, LacI family [Sanguibacter gelidistatuariae]|uniref:Transcriptional regulator, LacI family n=1 Tax=Sanguibacter gelidistatuariae TaxID=1814289 RepID=A0A1G6UJ49_9MICO|nr:LacI family DNA-binding transcriptional regulator [Sanguibacter gelidistatuariae]SDD41418.1 transcriptional regulator, LacI family [Sanguibacter gelidistatuariae]